MDAEAMQSSLGVVGPQTSNTGIEATTASLPPNSPPLPPPLSIDTRPLLFGSLGSSNLVLTTYPLRDLDSITAWLVANGFENYVGPIKELQLDPAAFFSLNVRDLEKMNVPSSRPSDHTRLLWCIKKLSLGEDTERPPRPFGGADPIRQQQQQQQQQQHQQQHQHSSKSPRRMKVPQTSQSLSGSEPSAEAGPSSSPRTVGHHRPNPLPSYRPRPGLNISTNIVPSSYRPQGVSQTPTPICSADSPRSYAPNAHTWAPSRHIRARSRGHPAPQAHSNDEGEAGLPSAAIDYGYRSMNSGHVDDDELHLVRPGDWARLTTKRSSRLLNPLRNSTSSVYLDGDGSMSKGGSPTSAHPSPSVWLQNGSPNYLHISSSGTLSLNSMPVLGPQLRTSSIAGKSPVDRTSFVDACEPTSARPELGPSTNSLHLLSPRPSRGPSGSGSSDQNLAIPPRPLSSSSATLKGSGCRTDSHGHSHPMASGESSPEGESSTPRRRLWQQLPKGYANYKLGKPYGVSPDSSRYARYRRDVDSRLESGIASFISAKQNAVTRAYDALQHTLSHNDDHKSKHKHHKEHYHRGDVTDGGVALTHASRYSRGKKPRSAHARIHEPRYKTSVQNSPPKTAAGLTAITANSASERMGGASWNASSKTLPKTLTQISENLPTSASMAAAPSGSEVPMTVTASTTHLPYQDWSLTMFTPSSGKQFQIPSSSSHPQLISQRTVATIGPGVSARKVSEDIRPSMSGLQHSPSSGHPSALTVSSHTVRQSTPEPLSKASIEAPDRKPQKRGGLKARLINTLNHLRPRTRSNSKNSEYIEPLHPASPQATFSAFRGRATTQTSQLEENVNHATHSSFTVSTPRMANSHDFENNGLYPLPGLSPITLTKDEDSPLSRSFAALHDLNAQDWDQVPQQQQQEEEGNAGEKNHENSRRSVDNEQKDMTEEDGGCDADGDAEDSEENSSETDNEPDEGQHDCKNNRNEEAQAMEKRRKQYDFDECRVHLPASDVIKVRHQSSKLAAKEMPYHGDDDEHSNDSDTNALVNSDEVKENLYGYSALNQELYQQLQDHESTESKEANNEDEPCDELPSPTSSVPASLQRSDSNMTQKNKKLESDTLNNNSHISFGQFFSVFSAQGSEQDIFKPLSPSSLSLWNTSTAQATNVVEDSKLSKVRTQFQRVSRAGPDTVSNHTGDSDDDDDDDHASNKRDSKRGSELMSMLEFINDREAYQQHIETLERSKHAQGSIKSQPKEKKLIQIPSFGGQESQSKNFGVTGSVAVHPPGAAVSPPSSSSSPSFKFIDIRPATFDTSKDIAGQGKGILTSSKVPLVESADRPGSAHSSQQQQQGAFGATKKIMVAHRRSNDNDDNGDKNDDDGYDRVVDRDDNSCQNATTIATASSVMPMTRSNYIGAPVNSASEDVLDEREKATPRETVTDGPTANTKDPHGMPSATVPPRSVTQQSQASRRQPSDPNQRPNGLHISSMHRAPLRRSQMVGRRGQQGQKYKAYESKVPSGDSPGSCDQQFHRAHIAGEPQSPRLRARAGSNTSVSTASPVQPYASASSGPDHDVAAAYNLATAAMPVQFSRGEEGYNDHPDSAVECQDVPDTGYSGRDSSNTRRIIRVALEGDRELHYVDVTEALTGAGIYDKLSKALNIDARLPHITIAFRDDNGQFRKVTSDEELKMLCVHATPDRDIGFVIYGVKPSSGDSTSNVTAQLPPILASVHLAPSATQHKLELAPPAQHTSYSKKSQRASTASTKSTDIVDAPSADAQPPTGTVTQPQPSKPVKIPRSKPANLRLDTSAPPRDSGPGSGFGPEPVSYVSAITHGLSLSSIEIVRSPLNIDFTFDSLESATSSRSLSPLPEDPAAGQDEVANASSSMTHADPPRGQLAASAGEAMDSVCGNRECSPAKVAVDNVPTGAAASTAALVDEGGSTIASSPDREDIALSQLASATGSEFGITTLRDNNSAVARPQLSTRVSQEWILSEDERAAQLSWVDLEGKDDSSKATQTEASRDDNPVPTIPKPQIRRTWTLLFLNQELTFSDDESEGGGEGEREECEESGENAAATTTPWIMDEDCADTQSSADKGKLSADAGSSANEESPADEFKNSAEASLREPQSSSPGGRRSKKLSVRFGSHPPDTIPEEEELDATTGFVGKVTEKPQSEGPSRLIFDAPEIECGTNDYLDDSSSSGDDDSVDLVIRRHESISTNGSWRYIPGTRASSLRRKPTRTRASRPTTELIANNLDDFFPDHDLDKPIVQSVRLPVDLISLPDTTGRVPPSMFPTDEINIVMDEDDDANSSKPIVIGGNNGDPNDADPQVGHSSIYTEQNLTGTTGASVDSGAHTTTTRVDAPDVSGNSGTKDAHFVPKQLAPGGTKRAEESGDIPVTRRKSLRMLVRESRNNLSSMRSRFDFLPPIPQSHRQGGRGKDRTPPPSVYPGHAVNVRTPPHIISTFNRSLEDRPTNPMSRRLGVIITNPNKDNRPLAAALASTSIQPLSPLTNESSGLPPYSAEVQSSGTSGNWSSTSDSWNSADHKDLKTPTFLRRSSTKMWGGIPQEIRPKRRGIARIKNVGNPAQTQQPAALYHDKNIAAAVAHPSLDQQKQQQADSTDPDKLAESLRRDMSQQEIVRRALSLLQKPDHSPQDEQRIIETAIKQGLQNSTVGTRRQFTEQQAKWDRRQRTESMNSTVQALFGAHGPPSAPIKIQWLKGKRIGKGSFGQVHIALNALNGEIIAVKQIRIPSLDNANKKRRNKYEKQINQLYSEIGVLKDIEHENIVQYLGFDVSRSMMNIFLEYVPGGTVRSLTKEYGPLAEPVVNSFLQQILAGLEYLHSRNILHRDIKGANILVTEQGVCKISDFGISKKTNQSRRAYDRHTRVSSNPEGTVFWMAPEAARSERFSAKVDVWSLGCVTIEMWTGQRPWVNMDETQVIFRLAKTSEPPPLPADITEDGNDFCKHCLQPNPDDRWTASQLRGHKFAQPPPGYSYNDYYYTTD